MRILPGIRTLVQHFYILKQDPIHPSCCPRCGEADLIKHGFYYRKADRESGDLNPVPIQRFICGGCHVTCSALPECIPRRRWYLWDVQQQALLLYLMGLSLQAITKVLSPAAHTVARWVKRFQDQFLLHTSVLRELNPDLGRSPSFGAFWQACLKECSLAEAMRFCHVAHVAVP